MKKLKVGVFVCLLLLTGFVAGVFWSRYQVRQHFKEQRGPGNVIKRWVRRLESSLKLDQRQARVLRQKLREHRKSLERLRSDTRRKAKGHLQQVLNQLEAELRPEQLQKLDQLRQKLNQYQQRH